MPQVHSSLPLFPLGQQDWRGAKGEREDTQAHLKEGETESHPSDPGRKLRLTDVWVRLENTHPTGGKTWNQVQVYWLLLQFFFHSAMPLLSGEMPIAGHREMRWFKKVRVQGKENGGKDPGWWEFLPIDRPLWTLRLCKLFIDVLLSPGYSWISFPQTECTHKLEPIKKQNMTTSQKPSSPPLPVTTLPKVASS